MRGRIVTAARDGAYKMKMAQAAFDDFMELKSANRDLAHLWGEGSICDRH